jgi:hypothetical protein
MSYSSWGSSSIHSERDLHIHCKDLPSLSIMDMEKSFPMNPKNHFHISHTHTIYHLVGGLNHLEKY